MMRLSRKGGLARAYTLTEMLVVLVIIGLLAAIVGPRLFNRLDDAKRRTARLQLVSLQTSVDLFRLDVGRLPTDEEGLIVLVQPPAGEESTWLGPYLARDAIPLDPWGHAYEYEAPAEGGAYRIVSLGADRTEGGSGAAADIVVSADGASS
jgi:general secretion pathway protein G